MTPPRSEGPEPYDWTFVGALVAFLVASSLFIMFVF